MNGAEEIKWCPGVRDSPEAMFTIRGNLSSCESTDGKENASAGDAGRDSRPTPHQYFSGFSGLELLNLVSAFFQQFYDAIWTGEVQRASHDRSRLIAFKFRFDPRNPFGVTAIDKARCDPGSLFAQSTITCPKRIGVTFAPRLVHPAEFLFGVPGLVESVTQNEFAIAI